MSIGKKSYYIIYVLIGTLILATGLIFILRSNIEFVKQIPNLKKYAILLGIGGSLLASSIVYFLDLVKDLYKSNLQKKISNVIFDAGIEEIYRKRDLDKYDVLIKDLNNSIDISGYSLNAFNDSYSHILKQKLAKNSSIRIRILLVNPNSYYAKERENQEGNAENTYLNSVNKIIDTYKDSINVSIRIVDTPLPTMFFRIDNVLFIGPHLYKRSSKSTVTYELRKSGWLFDEYQNDFVRLWESGKECKEKI